MRASVLRQMINQHMRKTRRIDPVIDPQIYCAVAKPNTELCGKNGGRHAAQPGKRVQMCATRPPSNNIIAKGSDLL